MDLFAHITIPLLILLALRVDTRKILLMLPFAVILELDVFFGYHRFLFHNVFIAFLLPLAWTILIYKYKKEWFSFAWIALFFMLSHLMLDLTEGIAFYYPMWTTFYDLEVSLYIQNFYGPIPIPDFSIIVNTVEAQQTVAVGESLGAAETARRYPTMDDVSVALLFTLIVASLMYFRKSFVFLKEVYQLTQDIYEWCVEKIKSILKKMKGFFD